jgi:hypothetical protein
MNTAFRPICRDAGSAAENKQIAQKYNLRYVTYEAGQHVVLLNNVDLMKQIERDPRMYDSTNRTSTRGSQFGDLITLFAMTGLLSGYGAWGMTEYMASRSTRPPSLERFVTSRSARRPVQRRPPGLSDGSVIPLTARAPSARRRRRPRRRRPRSVLTEA